VTNLTYTKENLKTVLSSSSDVSKMGAQWRHQQTKLGWSYSLSVSVTPGRQPMTIRRHTCDAYNALKLMKSSF